MDFHPSGRSLVLTLRWAHLPEAVTAARQRLARIFDADTGQLVRDVAVPGFLIGRAAFSPDGRRLACALETHTEKYNLGQEAAVVDVELGEVLDRLRADFEAVYDFAFLPHRNEVAVFGHARRPMVLWRPVRLEERTTL